MLYDASGTLIYDVIEPDPMGVVLQNNGAYFIGTVIDLEAKTVQSLVCDEAQWMCLRQQFVLLPGN